MKKEDLKGGWASLRRVNPFVLLLLGVLLTLLYPGDSSIFSHLSNHREIFKLERERNQLREGIERDRRHLDELRFRKDKLEKYAREKYLMKAEDEDLYLLHQE